MDTLQHRWTLAGFKALRVIGRRRLKGWAEAELEDASLPDDPDWCRMVVSFANGAPPVRMQGDFADDEPTYRCGNCQDKDIVTRPHPKRAGVMVAGRCPVCLERRNREIQEQGGSVQAPRFEEPEPVQEREWKNPGQMFDGDDELPF